MADSSQTGFPPSNAFDGNDGTYWHTQYEPDTIALPHRITIDMTSVYAVNGITYLPRQDGSRNGNIGEHQVFVSTDGNNFNLVAFGTWMDDQTLKSADFEPVQARYVRIVALTEAGNRGPWTSAAEFSVYNAGSYTPPPIGRGQWGPTINFPIVPVAASVQPETGNVVAWSSWSPSEFGGPAGVTMTAVYDPSSQTVSGRTVSQTGHDMFCPGISMDVNGRTIVTGGDNAQKTSIYDSGSDSWLGAADMNIPRGYQSSATCSDGRVFTIGGSWSGGEGGKIGEIYNVETNSWELLQGCPVDPLLTADQEGVYRADNHAWLFGWKNGSVFQAGPSTAMNWYGTNGAGSQQPAGDRAGDLDAMCGNAVMYDALAGKVLTIGGSLDYQNTQASTAAHLITIGDPGTIPQVTTLGGMAYPRTFHTSVVLPDGKVFITGGQSVGAPFADSNVQYTPEMWDPTTGLFTQLVPNSTPRVYHSFALLLQDATVLSGGGGLCGSCSANHYDAQVYTPSYLLNADGSKSSRPTIISVSTNSVMPGASITVSTDTPVTSMSLVRYGSSTHTVNTDQRRIPLALQAVGANSYAVAIPSDSGVALPGFWMLFAMDAAGHPSVATTIKIGVDSTPPVTRSPLPRTGWTAVADTFQEGNAPGSVLDGDVATFWHSQWDPATQLPHNITIDMKTINQIDSVTYLPRQDGTPNGYIGEYQILVSTDGSSYSQVASGGWLDSISLKTVDFPIISARFVRLVGLTEAGNRGPWTSAAEINVYGTPGEPGIPGTGTTLPRTGWIATADSYQAGNEPGDALDGNTGTFWHSQWDPLVALPHMFTVDMGLVNQVNGITYLPRQDAQSNGNIGQYQIWVSMDGTSFNQVASGTWVDSNSLKTVDFANPSTARFIRLVAVSEAGNRGAWSSIADFNVVGTPGSSTANYLPRTGWTATADGFQASAGNQPGNALDGNTGTFWHSQWDPATQLPHALTIDMKAIMTVNGVAYLPRQDDNSNGNIGQYQVFVSTDGTTFTQVVSGTWIDSNSLKTAMFPTTVSAQFIRLVALTEAGNRGAWTSAAEINVSAP
jgi:galactose oxidase